MKNILFLLLVLRLSPGFAQNMEVRIKPTIKNSAIGFTLQEPFVDIEGYNGDEIIIDMLYKGKETLPDEAAGLKQIPIANRDRVKDANTLTPQIKEDTVNAGISISIPPCNCAGLKIKVPQNQIVGVVSMNFSRVGRLSIKNINDEVQIQGWSPLIELRHVAGFIIITGGAKAGGRASDKIILSDIQWTDKTVMFDGRPRPREYVVYGARAGIDLEIPDSLKANIIYRAKNGLVFSDLNSRPVPATEDMIKQYATVFNSDPEIKALVLKNGGINIDIASKQGNIYLRKQQ